MAGGIEARLGHAERSEHFFQVARAEYRDVSPFTVAWIDFERARALEMAGNRATARVYLDEAAAVLPSYAHAVVHLAALEPAKQALRHIRELQATSDDPDVLAAEADALRRDGQASESAEAVGQARASFEQVLATLPKAFADHAASFYLGVGNDAPRALELARANAALRPTSEAIELWLSAAQVARSRGDTCAASAKAVSLHHATADLRDRAMRVAKTCP
jgi:tetratricopeptide (TPR) repeat protein